MNIFESFRDMGEQSPRLYIIATGAGAGLQEKVWRVPGCSNFFVGAAFPYATEETQDVLGFTPKQFVSQETAIDLALAAYMRAYKPGRSAIGVGLTASVASTKAHRGDHRVIVAAFTDHDCIVISAILHKGVGDAQRQLDGQLADRIAMYAIRAISGVGTAQAGIEWHFIERELRGECSEFATEITVIGAMDHARARILAHPYFRADGTRGTLEDIDPKKTMFFPGSFRPFHEGHLRSGEACLVALRRNLYWVDGPNHTQLSEDAAHANLIYVTTVDPVHKEKLSPADMLQRAVGMKGRDFLLSEGDPLYIQKARKFPGCRFAVGADTMDRMLDPSWGVTTEDLVREFHSLGVRFFVPSRLVGDRFLRCQDIIREKKEALPKIDINIGETWADTWAGMSEAKRDEYRAWLYMSRVNGMFVEVDFRMDISSTELRAKAASST